MHFIKDKDAMNKSGTYPLIIGKATPQNPINKTKLLFFTAAEKDYKEIVELLLKNGANANVMDESKQTALLYG